MWEPVALCCFTRRTGCLVLGSLEVIGAIFGLIAAMCSFPIAESSAESSAPSILCRHVHGYTRVGSCEENLRTAVYSILIIGMVGAAVQLVCASVMIHGVRTNNHRLMCPFLIKNLIVVVLHIIVCSIVVALFSVFSFVAIIPFAYCYGAMIFMWTYFLLTVRAYYYELKLGKADDHHRLVENCQVEIGDANKL